MPKISDEKRAERRNQILEAAWTCFQRQGLHATTMDDIIRASDLSAGAVYSYFAGKEDLILAAVTTSLTDLRARLEALLAPQVLLSPEDLIRAITAEIAGFSTRQGYDLRRIALLGWAESQRTAKLRQIMQGFYLAFRDRLAQAASGWKSTGRLPADADPQAVAKLLLSQILGFVVQSAITGDVTPDEMALGLRDLGASRGG